MAQAQFWLTAGTVVGNRYNLENVLGVGGYGITYCGMDIRLGRKVAVKEYYPSFWASRFIERGKDVHILQGMEEHYEKGMTRFLDEAKTLAQLAHISGVVHVSDFFEENETAYLVMEYLDGKNLKQMLYGFGGRIPADVLLPAISPVISSLRQVHAKGLIHRDISPDNIMMLSDGSVRLIDFGNARDTTDNKSMTLAMKEGFAAPEQYRSRGQGSWTDVYGVCATIYYCLTGKLPPQAMERLMGAPFPKPSELGVTIDPVQEQAIMDGLDLYVKQRIQTMEELWNRLFAVQEKTEEAPQPSYDKVQMESVWEPIPEDIRNEEPSFEYSAEIPVPDVPVPEGKGKVNMADANIDLMATDLTWEQLLHTGMAQIRNICAQIFSKLKER